MRQDLVDPAAGHHVATEKQCHRSTPHVFHCGTLQEKRDCCVGGEQDQAEAGEEELVSTPPNESVSADDLLVEALSRGDEDAFAALIDRYHASLLRVARLYVPSHALAEEVVQETWLGFLGGLARFEGRCSLKT
jgi:hypothetical protein